MISPLLRYRLIWKISFFPLRWSRFDSFPSHVFFTGSVLFPSAKKTISIYYLFQTRNLELFQPSRKVNLLPDSKRLLPTLTLDFYEPTYENVRATILNHYANWSTYRQTVVSVVPDSLWSWGVELKLSTRSPRCLQRCFGPGSQEPRHQDGQRCLKFIGSK